MTARWTAAELVGATGGRLTVPFDATGIAIDTRTLAPGDLFVALRGEHRDGHAFVAAALARGAAGAMVAGEAGLAADAPLLVVGDTLAGLVALGAAGRARFTGRLVAITGSVGKTTTKEMLRIILAAQAPTFAAAASHNNHWGVPLTLARLPAAAAFCIAELGMNHAGEIAPLARLARPQVAVITAIASAHIGHLGSIAAIAEEKAAIMLGLEPGGAAVLPADSDHLPRLRAAARAAGVARVVTFGADPAADVRLDAATDDAPVGDAPNGDTPIGNVPTGNVPIGNALTGNAPTGDAPGTEVRASVGGEAVAFRLNAPGRHMALNALAALAAAVVLGVPPAAAARALAGFAPMSGRGARRIIAVPGGTALLLDESYNANGASIRAALAVLGATRAARRIAVLGDMLELGAHGPAEHAALGPDVAAAADHVFACGPLMAHLCAALPAGLPALHAADAAVLAAVLGPAIRPGDAVLVKGSLGSNMKLIVAALERLAEAA